MSDVARVTSVGYYVVVTYMIARWPTFLLDNG